MIRLLLIIFFLSISLLTIFSAPEFYLWYVAILVTEFCWVFIGVVLLLIFLNFGAEKYKLAGTVLGVIALILFASPIVRAMVTANNIDSNFNKAFSLKEEVAKGNTPVIFSLRKMFTGINSKQIHPDKYTYSTTPEALSMDFYPSEIKGKRPCVILIHGGSWAGGDCKQLPELNTWLAKKGYHAAAINYSLAPKYKSPKAVENVFAAIKYLKQHSDELNVDTNNFVLLGRSAGGQIALMAAYVFHDENIRGVINFYGPADMVWGYAQPANPLVFDSRKVMEDYLGGTYQQVPQQYVNSSPVEAVSILSPPTLMIHGKNDPLVAYEHETRLGKKLMQFGIPHFLLTLPWATHGCDYTLNGPSGQLCTYTIERFLETVIKK